MGYVKFSNVGYEYFGKDQFLLFSTDRSCGYLLDYAAKDLSHLSELLDLYISKRLNTTTFEVICEQHCNSELSEIEQLLRSTHPYYEHEYKTVILKAIGEYFNSLLMYSVALHHVSSKLITQGWYQERFVYLTQEVLGEYDSYPKNLSPKTFFAEFEKWEKDAYPTTSNESEEEFLLDVSSKRPNAIYQ